MRTIVLHMITHKQICHLLRGIERLLEALTMPLIRNIVLWSSVRFQTDIAVILQQGGD